MSFYLALGENIEADDGYIIVRMKVKPIRSLDMEECANGLQLKVVLEHGRIYQL